MIKIVVAYAALVGVALSVACSSTDTSTNAAATASPAPPLFTAPPQISYKPVPQKNCANPGANLTFFDTNTHQAIPVPPDIVVSWQPFWFPFIDALQWTVKDPSTGKTFVVNPAIPLIVGEVSQATHDESTMEVLPYGTPAEQKLVQDDLAHYQYTAQQAEIGRTALLTGNPTPAPNPSAAARDDFFLGQPAPLASGSLATASPVPSPYEMQLVAAVQMGSPPDDTDFQDSPGDPDDQDPHEYDYSCGYLNDENYALIWHVETRIPQFTGAAYTAVQATLAANKAQPAQKGSVGWVADQYQTWVALPVTPEIAPMIVMASPSPGAFVPLIQNNIQPMFKLVACQNLFPLPTPLPSGAPPTPAPTPEKTCGPPGKPPQ
jgi:hypothetical protein